MDINKFGYIYFDANSAAGVSDYLDSIWEFITPYSQERHHKIAEYLIKNIDFSLSIKTDTEKENLGKLSFAANVLLDKRFAGLDWESRKKETKQAHIDICLFFIEFLPDEVKQYMINLKNNQNNHVAPPRPPS